MSRARVMRSGLTWKAASMAVLCGLLWAALPAAPASGAPPIIPREVLFGNPERTQPRLSPDGLHLAYLAPEEGVLNLWVRTVGQTDDRVITKDRGRGIMAYFWAQNNEQLLYIQDKNGDENWHVYAVPLAGGEPVDLTPYEGVQAQVVDVDAQFPDLILVGINNRNPQLHDLYRINTRTGESVLEAQNDVGAVGWIADHTFHARIAQVPTPDGGFTLLHRAGAEAPWAPILTWGSDDAMTTSPFAFAADNRTLYMISSIGSNTGQLRAFDIEAKTDSVLASDPVADVSDLFIHPVSHRIQAVAMTKHREVWTVLDPGVKSDFDVLSVLHYGDFGVVNRDLADKTWLVAYSQDKGPVLYYSYDRESQKGTLLFSARPKLESVTLAAMTAIEFKSRDGLTIHGYLTLPPGGEPFNLPVVVNVHGGPWYRVTWGYNPEAQWLANRGYAVLEVNFRGSTGYGKEFLNAGDKEWCGRMQDDISDGVQWLVGQGLADPKRIAIYGGSYGGYATLCGLTKTPELYACGVDMVGPSNLSTFIQSIPPYWAPMKALLTKRIGDPDTEAEFLKERSPLFHIEAIRAPLFIAQGANDPRVNRAESIQIRDALQAAGKTVEYMEFPDEGHGFAKPENRLKFYSAAEAFLARHIGGRLEP